MAYEQPNFRVGLFQANIDMSVEASFQYTVVDLGVASGSVQGTGVGNAAIVAPISAGVPGFGILQNNPAQGEAATVYLEGISKAQYGANVAVNQLLMCGRSAGTLVPATSGNYAIAKALESGVATQIGTVLLGNYGKV